MKGRPSNGVRVLLVCAVAGAVAAVNAASASAALNICVRNSTGTVRQGDVCKLVDEHGEQLATAAELASQQTQIDDLRRDNASLRERVDQLANKLSAVSYGPSGTNNVPTFKITGANLQVVNGTGATKELNGRGNVIIGYNGDWGKTRTGSHNLVIGDYHSYTSHSGIATGYSNTLSGAFSFVSGDTNTASGYSSFVGGGASNRTFGNSAFVGGGVSNAAVGNSAFVSGDTNTATGYNSFVGGGTGNKASEQRSFVGGGRDNTAFTDSFVGGGAGNKANEQRSFVGGGRDNTAFTDSFVGGGTNQTAHW